MAFSWTNLTNAANTHIWEHINNLAAAVAAAFTPLGTPPACRANTNAILTTTAGVAYPIPFGEDTLKTDVTMHSTTVNPERVYVRTAGRYDVVTLTQYATASSSSVALQKNGVTFIQAATPVTAQSAVTLVDTVDCVAGDYLTVLLTTTAAGTISNIWPCSLYVHRVSD